MSDQSPNLDNLPDVVPPDQVPKKRGKPKKPPGDPIAVVVESQEPMLPGTPVAARRLKISALMLRGVTVASELLRELGLPHTAASEKLVYRDIDAIREMWLRATVVNAESKQAALILKARELQREAHAAWEASKGKVIKKFTKKSGKYKFEKGKVEPQYKTVEETEEVSQGDVVYLDKWIAGVALEAKLSYVGEVKPVTNVVTNNTIVGDPAMFERVRQRAEQLRAGVGVPEINGIPEVASNEPLKIENKTEAQP